MRTDFSLFTKRTRVFWNGLALATVIALILTACGGGTTATTTTTAAPTDTPTTAPAAPAVVKTGTATTKSGSQTVLTNAQGLTLYYFDTDTATTSACTAACAQAWPPLLFTGSGQPTAEGSLTGPLTVVTTANGMQVAYNSHLLYTFQKDTAAGTATGDGLKGVWHVATPGTTALSATPPVIKTGMATTKSGKKTVLTNAQGLTLYYFDLDTATTSACTGGCAKAWQPLIFSGSGQPTADGSLTGQLTAVTTANGMQVAYNGHFLYTYDDDKAPGTAEGDGELGKWHAATPDLKAAS